MARAPRLREAWSVVKKRVRRKGGDEVGEEVSALQSHWRTEMLRITSRRQMSESVGRTLIEIYVL